jgi:pseudouridine-5'-phosphate glycosidase
MIAAERAGIRVFATGGIGGVHRGAEDSFDISADLEELGRTGVIVVCAGAKAILDVPKTLEVLETAGVPVVTYESEEFPAFWSRDPACAAR